MGIFICLYQELNKNNCHPQFPFIDKAFLLQPSFIIPTFSRTDIEAILLTAQPASIR